jgi:hypothetical protein
VRSSHAVRAVSCLVGCVPSLRSAFAGCVFGRAPRSCREQGCAAHCRSVAHASDVPRSYGVRCARRGSGVRVPCRAWLRRPSAHQVHFAQRYAMWWCAALCGACVHDESVGAIVVRASA